MTTAPLGGNVETMQRDKAILLISASLFPFLFRYGAGWDDVDVGSVAGEKMHFYCMRGWYWRMVTAVSASHTRYIHP